MAIPIRHRRTCVIPPPVTVNGDLGSQHWQRALVGGSIGVGLARQHAIGRVQVRGGRRGSLVGGDGRGVTSGYRPPALS
jgi:hypothetical protein